MQDLYSCVLATLSPQAETRRSAEALLESASSKPGFLAQLLQLIASGDDARACSTNTTASALAVRQAAAIYFKNVVKRRWEDAPLEDRAALRAALLPLTAERQSVVRRQLVEAIAVIGAHDFPNNWPELLAFVVDRLQTCLAQPFEAWDGDALQGVLETLEALVERYRHETRSDPLFQEILVVLGATQEPLLLLFQRMCVFWRTGSKPSERHASLVLTAMRHVAEIFYSLNYQDLPEFFEDHMTDWMVEFGWILQADQALYEHVEVAPLTALPDAHALGVGTGNDQHADLDEEASPLDTLQARIIESMILYAEKYEEEFRPFLASFVTAVCALLVRHGLHSRYDGVVIAGIRFLTTVARGVDFALLLSSTTPAAAALNEANLLHYICENVVAPNMQLRESDIELFTEMPRDFIRLELDGTDVSNRRRAASELLRALLERFEERITILFSSYVNRMLEAYAFDPQTNWKQKVNAILIVSALSWRAGTRAAGATFTSEFVDISGFTKTQIRPEIERAASKPSRQSPPALLIAEALKFLILFRGRLTASELAELRPFLIHLLGNRDTVVHSYAARFLERVLASTRLGNEPPTRILDRVEIERCVEAIAHQFSRDPENEYLMKLLLQMASLVSAKESPSIVRLLAMDLQQRLGSFTNPVYSHYLFETLVMLTRSAGVSAVESLLFPIFEQILQQDIVELTPYVFQTLAQMVLWRGEGLTEAYRRLLPPLLAPPLWDRHGYIPSMVSLLVSFLRTDPKLLCDAEHLPRVLGVFQKLVSFRTHDHDGLRLLSAIVDACSSDDRITPYLGAILQVLFLRLQSARTPKFVRHLLACLAHIVVRIGAAKIFAAVDALQPALFEHFLDQVWIPELRSPERSPLLCDPLVGKTICCAMVLMAEARPVLWTKLLDPTLGCCLVVETQRVPATENHGHNRNRILERDQHANQPLETEEAFVADYSVEHAELRSAQIPPVDPCPQVTYPVDLLLQMLARYCGSTAATIKFITEHCQAERARLALERIQMERPTARGASV
ncbi:hypothetical protein CCYA_CCYA08G2471 [Cyanidiococcus yangmingshanensis]|nr:hypothetical protein CCYA_CCYA08G2471 [Cyanidiococcus yangmingshanensis]